MDNIKIISQKVGDKTIEKLEVSVQQPAIKQFLTKEQIQKKRDFYESEMQKCDAQLAMFSVTP